MITWIMCIVGQIMHLAAQVWTIKQAPNNTAATYAAVLKHRAIPIVVRMFIGTMLFGLFFGGGLPELYKAFDAEVPSWAAIVAVLLGHTGIVGWCMSGLVGFGLDSAITFIPFFKSYIPPPIDQIAEQRESNAFMAGAEATRRAARTAVDDAAVDVKDARADTGTGTGTGK